MKFIVRSSSNNHLVMSGEDFDKNQEYVIVYFLTHDHRLPGRDFLNEIPPAIAEKFAQVLIAVAKAPPHRFAGGGYWQKMRSALEGLYKVRIDNKHRKIHYRLFCLLDIDALTRTESYLVILCGASKKFHSLLSRSDYQRILTLRNQYLEMNPRSIG